MKRFEKKILDQKDYRNVEIAASFCRALLTPIFIVMGLIRTILDKH